MSHRRNEWKMYRFTIPAAQKAEVLFLRIIKNKIKSWHIIGVSWDGKHITFLLKTSLQKVFRSC